MRWDPVSCPACPGAFICSPPLPPRAGPFDTIISRAGGRGQGVRAACGPVDGGSQSTRAGSPQSTSVQCVLCKYVACLCLDTASLPRTQCAFVDIWKHTVEDRVVRLGSSEGPRSVGRVVVSRESWSGPRRGSAPLTCVQ